MTAIRCRLRVVVDKDPEQAKMLKELQIDQSANQKVLWLDTILNSRVLQNALMAVKTDIPTIAVQFLGQPPGNGTFHYEWDEEVFNKIHNVIDL